MIATILAIENGSVNVSFANVMHLMDVHGKIVGIVHAIAPFEYADETNTVVKSVQQVTQIFFSKGYIHTAHGFAVGYEDGLREERFYKVCGFQQIVAMIPGWALTHHQDAVYGIGLEKIVDKSKFFIFKVPSNILIEQIKNSRGYQAFEKALEIYQIQGENMLVVGEENHETH